MDLCKRITLVNGVRMVFVVILTILACSSAAGNTVNYNKRCNLTQACVSVPMCKDGKIDPTGSMLIGPRTNSEECIGFDKICCILEQSEPFSSMLPTSTRKTTTPTTTPPTTTTTTEEPDDPNWGRQCGQRTNVTENTDQELETNRFEFPWSVALFSIKIINRRPRKEFLCGGILLDDYIVITAARCVQQVNREALSIELGRWDLHAQKESRTQEIAVEKLIVHPDYVASSFTHNIALLVLESPAKLGRAANRVCLADSNIKIDNDSLCYVVGWSNLPTSTNANRQLKLRSSFANARDCTESVRSASRAKNFVLPKENICTYYMDNTLPCERAPGSGLVCESTLAEKHYFLVGIGSYALRNCSKYRVHDVFSKISEYTAWIDDRVMEQEREPAFYRPDPNNT